MKNKIYISQKWRRLTALFLLFNFFITPLVNAFPQDDCNGVCETTSTAHECSTEMVEAPLMEMDCCDMMEMNLTSSSNNSSECSMKISDINCALVSQKQTNHVYLLPKTIDVKIEFVQMAIIDFNADNSNLELFDVAQDLYQKNKPPIYLTNSVFLI
jgi:hypothetical protein